MNVVMIELYLRSRLVNKDGPRRNPEECKQQ